MSERIGNLNAIRNLARARDLHDQIVSPENNKFISVLAQQAIGSLAGAATPPPWLAEAFALLADVLITDYLQQWNGAGDTERDGAQVAIDQALTLDPDLALGHYVCGLVKRAQGDHKAALAAFEKATAIDRDFARAYAQRGNELINIGQPGDAPPLAQKAIDLSPYDPSIAMFYWILGRAYFMAGFYPDAKPWFERSIVARNTVWYTRTYLVASYALLGEIELARGVLNDFLAKFPNYDTITKIIELESHNPTRNDTVKRGREKLHEGLLLAGLPP